MYIKPEIREKLREMIDFTTKVGDKVDENNGYNM